MRGYYSSFGYCGLVDGEYKLFATEEDYRDYMTQRYFIKRFREKVGVSPLQYRNRAAAKHQ